MSVEFIWEDKYSVGRDDIDVQHKRLFELGNAIDKNLTKPEVEKIVLDLYEYTREHFVAEETMMKAAGYPKVDEHALLHEDLITKLNDASAQVFFNDDALFAFKKFVYDWLIDHILNRDMDYVKFIHEN